MAELRQCPFCGTVPKRAGTYEGRPRWVHDGPPCAFADEGVAFIYDADAWNCRAPAESATHDTMPEVRS